MKKMITRRNFLKAAGVSAAALGLAACGGSSSSTASSAAGVRFLLPIPAWRPEKIPWNCKAAPHRTEFFAFS